MLLLSKVWRDIVKVNKKQLTLTVNGEEHILLINPDDTLLNVLRNQLNLTGVKEGCNSGECGACVVFVGNKLVNSCLYIALEADGEELLTIEGLSQNGDMHPIQQSFIDAGAVQCGYCTPGMVLATKDLLDRNPEPQNEDIIETFNGHLCRCTGYVKVFDAIRLAKEYCENDKLEETI